MGVIEGIYAEYWWHNICGWKVDLVMIFYCLLSVKIWSRENIGKEERKSE